MATSAGGYILRVGGDRRAKLLAAFADGFIPAEPVPTFKHPRNAALVVFGCFGRDAITHVASGRMGVAAGSGLKRLNLEDMETLPTPVSLETLLTSAPGPVKHHIERVFVEGGLLPPRSLSYVVDQLLKVVPSLAGRLARYGADRGRRIAEYTDAQIQNLALQKETLSLALRIGDFRKDEVLSWSPTDDTDDNFLHGLPQTYSREDPMLISDLASVPGFEAVRDLPFAAREFVHERNPKNRLTVIMANRTELEKQTGADLIYYNRTHGCLILVQYKAMTETSDKPEFRWAAGDDLDKEVTRMIGLRRTLQGFPADTSQRGFRFSQDPFFLKICRRIHFDPDSAGLFPGMYFPLGLWERLAIDPVTLGPRGGRMLNYANATRRMSNSEFVELVRGGWIGTTLPQSAALKRLIEEILMTGKAVTFAIKDDGPPPDDGSDMAGDLYRADEDTDAEEPQEPLLN